MRRILLSLTVLLLLFSLALTACQKPHTHEWGEWQVTKEPTCTERGSRRRACTCGASGSETIPLIPHVYEHGLCTVCGTPAPSTEADDPSGPDLDWFG